ncbi:MAG: response regulator [Chloroflexi bacterium]|nr:MAG: response regulator [Chloroflexota bacterium]
MRRVLVVDDDIDAAEALGELLRDCGHEVATAHDGVGLSDAVLVALSGYDEDRHRRLAREAGFDRHVTKPVDAAKLEELLKLPL